MTSAVIRTLVLLHVRKILAEKSNLFWMFGMPIMFTVLMGMMFGTTSSSGPSEAPEVTVYDASRSAASGDLIASLGGREQYRIVVADTVGSEDLARQLVDDGRRTAALWIPAAFDDSLTAGRPAPLRFFFDSDRASAQTSRTALAEAVRRLDAIQGGRHAAGAGEFDQAVFDSLWAEPRVVLAATTLGRQQQEESALAGMSSGFQHTGPSYTLMFVMMFMLMSVRDIVLERRAGTLTRLRLGAASSTTLAAGLFLGPLLVGLAQAAVLLGFNTLLPGMDYGDSVATLIVVMVLFTGVSSALALVAATFCRTTGQADGMGMTVSMLMASLGGLWWPLEIVPGFMKQLALMLPSGRAITVFHNMIGRGWGLTENAPHLLWLVGALLILMVLARVRLRRLIA